MEIGMRTPLTTDADLEAAYGLGLLRKEALVDGQYYQGLCRNAEVARWHGGTERFVHYRTKFGQRFLETIKHPVDERHFDVFRVTAQVEPEPHQVIDDQQFNDAAAGQGA